MMVLVAWLCACGTSDVPSNGQPPAMVRLSGEVVDSSGRPVVGAWVWWHGLDAGGFLVTYPLQGIQTDSAGQFRFQLDPLLNDLVTLGLFAMSPGCGPPMATITHANPDFSAPIVSTIVVPTPLPPARVTSPQLCTAGSIAKGTDPDYELGIRIDSRSRGDSLFSGRWRMNFRPSLGDWFGDIQGVVADGFVLLDFQVDNAIVPDCESFRLVSDHRGDGSWGPAQVLTARGCIRPDALLFFVEQDYFAFFP